MTGKISNRMTTPLIEPFVKNCMFMLRYLGVLRLEILDSLGIMGENEGLF